MTNPTARATSHSLTIGWLYPTLMSTYGDRGNIIVLEKRSAWRNIQTTTKRIEIGTDPKELELCDLFFMGGAQDVQQEIVNKDLLGKKGNILKQKIESGIPGLFICGAYQFLGTYYKLPDGKKIEGLSVFDLYTQSPGSGESRLIGNSIIQTNGLWQTVENSNQNKVAKNKQQMTNSQFLVGFENHGGRTYPGKNFQPLGTVVHGFGNNGKDGTEGALFKNAIGTYLHGPVLPKNPNLCDFLLEKSLSIKYNTKIELEHISDILEEKARQVVFDRYLKK